MSEKEEFIPYIDFLTGQVVPVPTHKKPSSIYSTSAIVHYSNTAEYRACLRKLFQMNKENIDITLAEYKNIELDEETLDELAYDEKSATKVLDYVYDCTKDDPLFQNVYQLAAALMFSQDMNIGLSVLFSYDYLHYFHPCIVMYLQTPQLFNHDTPCYLGLCKKLN